MEVHFYSLRKHVRSCVYAAQNPISCTRVSAGAVKGNEPASPSASTPGFSVTSLFCGKKVNGRPLLLSFLLVFLISATGLSQSTALKFDTIPYSSNDLLSPGRGANTWYTYTQSVQIPTPGSTVLSLDNDTRFLWSKLQPTSAGVYDWSGFDTQIQYAIDHGQKFSFGIMPVCSSCVIGDLAGDGNESSGGYGLGYPLFVHNAMQAESTPDWKYSGGGNANMWIPNWNSNSFLSAWETFLTALAAHIANTTYKGVSYSSVVYHIDVRGYGNWGEWHTYPWRDLNVVPTGALASDASLQRIIAAHVTAFPNFPLIALVGAFNVSGDAGSADRTTAAVGYYALTTKNNWGPLGYRSDHLGTESTDSWVPYETTLNTYTYNGVALKTLITARWQTSPIVGEPEGSLSEVSNNGAQCAFYNLVNEVNLHHISQFSNENLVGNASCSQAFYLAASKASGYRLQFKSGSISSTLSPGSNFTLALNWSNIGLAPVYENWNTILELRTSTGTVAWTGTSSFKPKLFLPGQTTVTDNFTLPSTLATGSYSLYLIVRDPNGYRKPLPLANTGVGADGSYLISKVTVASGGSTAPPTVTAGPDQAVTLPTNSVSLTGTVTDLLSTLSSSTWTQASGPSTATIGSSSLLTTTVSNMVAGTYVFQLKIIDLLNLSATATVKVTVNPAPTPPTVSAGNSQTITLPTNTINLNGTASDATGTITGYTWSQVSGPATATISTASALATSVKSLQAGTYVFKLTVTDSWSLSSSATVTIIVNPAANQLPVANAGANQSVTLPVSTVTLNGGSSNDPDGSIVSYSWAKTSGPAQGTITSSTKVSTTVTGLVQGVYVFTLSVTDNSGATTTDAVTITVNAPANQPPVADAGASKTITLPTNSVSLDGTKSSDPDGTIASYAWSQVSGPGTSTLQNATTASPIAAGLIAGKYVFLLTVTDNSGATATAQTNVIVSPAPNQSPIADAGGNQSIALPVNTVTLNGSASQDPDGTISRYSWTKISGSAATLSNGTTAIATLKNLLQGVYVYQLTVTDNSGATNSDTVTITVSAAPNQAPVADAGASKSITLPVSTVSLDGSKSNDPDGSIAVYAWSQVSGPSTATIANANSANPVLSGLIAGKYVFQLTVTDNSGATATAQTNVIVSAAANQPPVADAGGNLSVTLPVNTAILNGTGSSDPDGSIVTYQWSKVSGAAATLTNAGNASANLSGLAQGVYVYRLTVTDNSGASASDTISITVNAAPNQPPVADAGQSQSITLPVNTANLDGTQSADPDGTIASFAWTQISGPSTATFTNANTATPAVSNLLVGKYVFQLTVTDNSGAKSTAQTNIIVSAAINLPPVANAGGNQAITLPVNTVSLDGTGSQDPDGTITAYSWSQVSGPAQGTIANADFATTAITGLVQGNYVFRLTVTDNTGATSTDSLTVAVSAAPNQPPVADAGQSQSITLPVNNVSLDGSASSDPDGTITFAWSQVSGPSTAAITGANTATPAISGLVEGQYVFQLMVTDNGGASDIAQVNVTVTAAANVNPVANAGADMTIRLPDNSVTLDGSASLDPGGNLTSYSWSQISGPAATIANPGSVASAVNNLVQGTYVFQLTVTNGGGNSASDSVTVIVNAAPNIRPIANAGGSKTITLPVDFISLDGTGSSDPDGTIVSYSWTELAGPATATITGAGTATPTVSALHAGNYYFQLTVSDNSGANAQAIVKITVRPAINLAPVANAGASQAITLPDNSVTLDASASQDADGTIAAYRWTKISGPVQGTIANANGVTTQINNMVQGTYIYQLLVTDNSGTTDADTVTVIVNPAPNQAPTANAGTAKLITLPVNSVSLDGTQSSDPDGTIASYSWLQTSGPATATVTGAGTATPALSDLQEGTYYFELTVTDNSGSTDKATVRITVRPKVNQSPIANAGASQVITLPVNTVTLDASASQDPDGTIATYSWTKISGPAQGTIVTPGNANTVINGLVQGVYTFKLIVTDNDGATDADAVTIVVNAQPNQPPVADAGSSISITLPSNSVSLDGTGSSDPDGTIAAYSWLQSSGPSTAIVTGANTATASASGLQEGTYYFELTVIDNNGSSSKASVKVTVRPSPNLPPIANAGANQTITLPVNTGVLDGSASVDPDGTIAGYNWTQISGPAQGTIANSGNAKTSVSNLALGTYIFKLTVTDNSGATDADNMTIIVVPAVNVAPIADAGASKTIMLPANSVSLDGTLSADPDGTIASYAWTQVSGPSTAGITAGSTATPTVTSLIQGQYIFQLTVTDNSGATGNAQVKVIVNAPPNQPPVADAGPDQTITLPVNKVTLNGTGSTDPDGNINSYTWSKISGTGAITVVNSTTATPSVIGLQAGTYVFQLTVTDAAGASSTDEVTITVLSASTNTQGPVANAGIDQTLVMPVNTVTLNGSKSSDAGGTITSYSWTQVSGSGASINGAGTTKPTVTGLQAGVYVFKLTVTDNNGASGTDQVTITINAPGAATSNNQPPVANAGSDTTIAIPVTSILLDGSASSDPDGTIVSYKWTEVSGPDSTVAFTSSGPALSLAKGLLVGEYVFMLTVTDNDNASSTATVKVNVVDNLRSTESMLLYPNPAQSTINLRLISDSTGNMKVNIYDMTGRIVMASEINKPQSFLDKPFNISQLSHGMYTMQVIIGTKKKMVSKFLKQ